jgi:hypothetical protein
MLLELEIKQRLVELQTVPITPLIYHNNFRATTFKKFSIPNQTIPF